MILAGLMAAAAVATAAAPAQGLGCDRGFDAVSADVRTTPNIKAYASADPLLETFQDSSLHLYAVTRPGHAAYPAVVKRTVQQSGDKVWVETASCHYGDEAAFAALLATFDRLNAALVAQFR